MSNQELIEKAATIIGNARWLAAFTGAGISAESGIPVFRGEGGIWEKFDPRSLELDYYRAHPVEAWKAILGIFAAGPARPAPNPAHRVLASWEARGLLKRLVTQNIDGLHHAAGSREVVEFHGSMRSLECLACGAVQSWDGEPPATIPPRCGCGGLLKPGFVFFGEGIPPAAIERGMEAAELCDAMIVVGTTGSVYPAAAVPLAAARRGAAIVEVNPGPSEFRFGPGALRIPLPAVAALTALDAALDWGRPPRYCV